MGAPVAGPVRLDAVRARLEEALSRPALQQPSWAGADGRALAAGVPRADEVGPDGIGERLRGVRSFLAGAPGVVSAAQIERLRAALADVAEGRAFVLHGGDCAETFADTTRRHLGANLSTLNAMADILGAGAGLPVVRIARMAGQFAKPRSEDFEPSGLPAYRGDMVNSAVRTRRARAHDPARMRVAYHCASAAMRVVRSAADGEVFVSHEALVLDYEAALTRQEPVPGAGPGLFGLSGHFLWVGERTRQLDGAHVAFARLIRNPIGVKIGPGTTPAVAAEYVERLDPWACPGRLTLISRMGADRVADVLPPIVERVIACGRKVVWQCDPMHGNTWRSASGLKTRHVDDVVSEIQRFVEVHRALGTHPGGLHLEFTGEPVTECVGGRDAGRVAEGDLGARYRTACDPRLNGEQALQAAAVAAGLMAPVACEER